MLYLLLHIARFPLAVIVPNDKNRSFSNSMKSECPSLPIDRSYIVLDNELREDHRPIWLRLNSCLEKLLCEDLAVQLVYMR